MKSKTPNKHFISRCVTTILFASFLVSLFSIIFATLSPFKFTFPNPVNQFNIHSGSSVDDFFRNIILFIPFSFTLSLLALNISNKNLKKHAARIFLGGCMLSLSVEILQLYLPQRTPTLIDIISNSLGGYIGYLVFKKLGLAILDFVGQFSRKTINFIRKKKNILFLLFIYFFLILFLTIHLNFLVSLSNWDSNFPLLIGNELTADRPWNGYLKELYIFNQEIGPEEIENFIGPKKNPLTFPSSLLLALDFSDSTDYQYAIPNLPPLIWSDKKQKNIINRSKGVSLDKDHWLRSAAAMTPLIDEISKSSQLSIITKISTKDLAQDGPARIVSISTGSHARNITLGQEDSSLIVRTRTPFTRENAARPSIVFPDIFVDNNSHYLAYTYNSKQAKLYLDNISKVKIVTFNFAAKFFWSLNDLPHFPVFTPNFIYPESNFLDFLNIVFYIVLALPIIILILCFLYAT